jgi:hypothetical protein
VSDMGTKPLEPKRHQEFKELPLAPPHCRRFLAVLALLSAIPPGEGGKVAICYEDPATRALACHGQEASYGHRFMELILLVVVISATAGAVRVYDRTKEACSGVGRAADTRRVASAPRIAAWGRSHKRRTQEYVACSSPDRRYRSTATDDRVSGFVPRKRRRLG